MNKIIFIIILISSLMILFYISVSFIAKRCKIDIDVEKELFQKINELNLNTKIKIKKKAKPCYDLQKNEIEINEGNNIKCLSEAFHELGHAFYNKFYAFKIYKKNNNYIKYFEKNQDEEIYCSFIINLLFQRGIIFSMILTLFGINLEFKILCILGLILSIISLFLYTINLWEEIKASMIASEIIKHEKYLNSKQQIILWFSFKSALCTYLFVDLFSSLMILLNVIFLFKK